MKQRKYKIIDIIKIENRTCADYEISGLIIEDNLIPVDSIINIIIQGINGIIIKIFDEIKDLNKAIIYICNSIAIRNKEIVFNKSKYEIQKITVDKTEIVQNLANEIATKSIFNGLRDFHEHKGRLCNRCIQGVHRCIECG
ncbi:hypothetical protein [Peptacetobacter hiranonis]|uniref:hypothetical protein n=1 Tax=Peptacetobacter hiranonis TaxID=89152 RepID=UPI0022E63B53|nr:hypothetical protein [Peptacetobacter hiranonis]